MHTFTTVIHSQNLPFCRYNDRDYVTTVLSSTKW